MLIQYIYFTSTTTTADASILSYIYILLKLKQLLLHLQQLLLLLIQYFHIKLGLYFEDSYVIEALKTLQFDQENYHDPQEFFLRMIDVLESGIDSSGIEFFPYMRTLLEWLEVKIA